MRSREIHLARRPEGLPVADDFRLVETEVPDLADGQLLIRQIYMSVDPYMRPQLSTGFPLDKVMPGGALGRIEASKNPDHPVGGYVRNQMGFREYAISDGRGLTPVAPEPGLPLSAFMSVLGGTGFTAYGGLLHIGQLKDGEQVFVSTAAGAVGSVAAQIAKIKGCYVVGSTGSPEKAAWLRDVAKLDAVIDYKATPIRQALKEAAPKGIDVYFENVGGEHLDAALAVMNSLGRIAVCGMISGYNQPGSKSAVYNLSTIIYGRINMRGFVGADFMHLMPQFQSDMRAWLREGRIQWRETVHDGIAEAPNALIGVMQGENIGKMLVKLSDA